MNVGVHTLTNGYFLKYSGVDFNNSDPVPFVQLNPTKVILVFSHEHNTFDKRKLLVGANPDVVRDSPKKVIDFIKDNALRRFYMVDLEKLLEDYAPGRPDMKPDVIAQTLQLEKEREKMMADAAAARGTGCQIILQQPGKDPVGLTNEQVVQIVQNLQAEVASRDKQIVELTIELTKLKEGQNGNDVPSVSNVDTDGTTNVVITNEHKQLIERYETLLNENRELRRQIEGSNGPETILL